MMLRSTGRTSRMLNQAIELLPDASKDKPIVIVGRDINHVRNLMHDFGKMAWDSGYHIKSTGPESFLIDDSARVDFKTPNQLERIMGMRDRVVEIFIDHYADECLPVTEQVAHRV